MSIQNPIPPLIPCQLFPPMSGGNMGSSGQPRPFVGLSKVIAFSLKVAFQF